MKQLTEQEESCLAEQGFSQTKTGLYVKHVADGTTFFWDFRNTLKGKYYATDNLGAFINDEAAKALPEYLSLREIQKLQPKNTAIPKKERDNKDLLEYKNEAYTLINERDDQQVIMELQGAFLSDFVYSFPTKEGKVTGLSWAGVKEVARRMGHISVDELNISETPDVNGKVGTYRVLAKAHDTQNDVYMFGIAEQAKKMLLRSGEYVDDLHALSKCVSRAQRNAIRTLIPEAFVKSMLESFTKGV